MSKLLTPWPDWNQRNDPPDDGTVDNNAANNCGPESVAEVIAYLTGRGDRLGVQLSADTIKDKMYGAAYQGYTDFAHLSNFLATLCGIPNHVFSTDDPGVAWTEVQIEINRGHPLIVLFWETTWDGGAVPGQGGHFCPVLGCTETTITRSNPWVGWRQVMSANEWRQWYNTHGGGILVCDEVRAA